MLVLPRTNRVAQGLGLLLLLTLTTTAGAKTRVVSSRADFVAASAAVAPGDEILIKDGIYKDWGVVTLRLSGTSARPIVVRGETPSGAILRGKINLHIEADWIVLRGVRFEGPSAAPPKNYTVQLTRATHVRLENITFVDCGNNAVRWLANVLVKEGVHALEVVNCSFENYKSDAFHMYIIPDVFPDYPSHIKILNSVFKDGRVEEAVSIGSGNSGNDGDQETYVLVERCTFDHHVSMGGNGDEMLHIKASKNTFRNNRFIGCKGHISNRQGHGNVFDGNIIQDQKVGIRVIDHDNIIINNLFLNTQEPIILARAKEGYHQVDNTTIAHNTFVGANGSAIGLIFASGSRPRGTVVANNVFIGPGGEMLGSVGDAPTITHNLFFATDKKAVIGITGAFPLFADPHLSSEDAAGRFPVNSPVHESGLDVAVGHDFLGRPRKAPVDRGHLEYAVPTRDAGVSETRVSEAGATDMDDAMPDTDGTTTDSSNADTDAQHVDGASEKGGDGGVSEGGCGECTMTRGTSSHAFWWILALCFLGLGRRRRFSGPGAEYRQ